MAETNQQSESLPLSDSDADSDTPLKSIAGGPSSLKRTRSRPVFKNSSAFLFQRLWSDHDEVAILKGMLDYKDSRGVDPTAEAIDFHHFVKKSLHADFSRKQVLEKIRRFRKRYRNSDGKRKSFFTPHDTIVLELSRKIWEDKPEKTTDLDPLHTTTRTSEQFTGRASVSMGLNESLVTAGLGLCSEDSKSEIEEKWIQLHLDEGDLFLRKLDLARQETQMILAAINSNRKK